MAKDVQYWCQSQEDRVCTLPTKVKTQVSPKVLAIPQSHLVTASENAGTESPPIFKKFSENVSKISHQHKLNPSVNCLGHEPGLCLSSGQEVQRTDKTKIIQLYVN